MYFFQVLQKPRWCLFECCLFVAQSPLARSIPRSIYLLRCSHGRDQASVASVFFRLRCTQGYFSPFSFVSVKLFYRVLDSPNSSRDVGPFLECPPECSSFGSFLPLNVIDRLLQSFITFIFLGFPLIFFFFWRGYEGLLYHYPRYQCFLFSATSHIKRFFETLADLES